jgi:hypothetical protein
VGRRQAGHENGRQAAGDNGRQQGFKRQRGRQAAAMRGAGKTGGFCNAFGRQNAPQTDTRKVSTRVNPVILYARTVILGPKKSKGQLRISEKKIGRKKMPSQTRQNISPSGNWQKCKKKLCQGFSNFLTKLVDGFQEPSSIL